MVLLQTAPAAPPDAPQTTPALAATVPADGVAASADAVYAAAVPAATVPTATVPAATVPGATVLSAAAPSAAALAITESLSAGAPTAFLVASSNFPRGCCLKVADGPRRRYRRPTGG
eukprot:GHVT01027508.1.p2 GENE.GHVT01027508.1~~GHVT01027508.1.p2  ORF type:complete len:117 (+),score=30.43 GHVT01027508.1:540-890(+)